MASGPPPADVGGDSNEGTSARVRLRRRSQGKMGRAAGHLPPGHEGGGICPMRSVSGQIGQSAPTRPRLFFHGRGLGPSWIKGPNAHNLSNDKATASDTRATTPLVC